MKVLIASDHAGFKLKEELKKYIQESLKRDVVDMGPDSPGSVDYPDFAHLLASKISSGEAERGVLVCGSGIGMCMAANRHKGVRAVILQTDFDAEMSRRHNNSNVACFGARNIISSEKIYELLRIWFSTSFEGGRHERRVSKIELNR